MLALALVLLAAPAPAPAAPAPAAPAAPAAPERLVTGTGLRLRAAPDANAAVVEKVALGTVLPCLEESRPVTVGDKTATFCKAPKGWYFTAVTEPLENDAAAQLDRLIDKRTRDLSESFAEDAWPDVYQLHRLMLRRIDERRGVDRLSARLAELTFVAAHAAAFHSDPRVMRDDSQGPRVKNEAFEKLVEDAKGTAAHEDAAWALYQHGFGGECEGYPPCVLVRAHRTACRFLEAYPQGERAKLAVADIIETLASQAQLEATANPADPSPSSAAIGDTQPAREVKKEARDALAKVKGCVQRARSGDTKKALALIEAAEQRFR